MSFFLSDFRNYFMFVLNLILVYINIYMAVFESDFYCAGYCAQKNIFRVVVIKTRDNRRT